MADSWFGKLTTGNLLNNLYLSKGESVSPPSVIIFGGEVDSKAEVWYVYILECINGSYYVGISTDVKKRFDSHKNLRGADFTKRFAPIKVAWQELHTSQKSARQREIQIKGWSRKKKEALISGII